MVSTTIPGATETQNPGASSESQTGATTTETPQDAQKEEGTSKGGEKFSPVAKHFFGALFIMFLFVAAAWLSSVFFSWGQSFASKNPALFMVFNCLIFIALIFAFALEYAYSAANSKALERQIVRVATSVLLYTCIVWTIPMVIDMLACREGMHNVLNFLGIHGNIIFADGADICRQTEPIPQ